jgi:hypothetical protein
MIPANDCWVIKETVQTAANSTNHDTPSFEKEYCGRSIVFAARELVV